MAAGALPPLLPYLQAVPDPRPASGRRQPLPAILALSCAAMLAGCDSLLAIAEWGRDPHAGAPLAERLGFTRKRSPCVATLHRVFRRLDVPAFERAVGQWAAAVPTVLGTRLSPAGIAVDGKVLRASRQPAVPAVTLLAALGHELGLGLAEVPVVAGQEEATTLPPLLAELVLAGGVVTLDAAFTERRVAAAIVTKGGPTCWWSKRINRPWTGTSSSSLPIPPWWPRPGRGPSPSTKGTAVWKCAGCGPAPRWTATATGRDWPKRCAWSARWCG